MQKRFSSLFIVFLLLSAFSFSSCKKDKEATAYKCTTCATAPEALAANDNSSKGIYKGIVIGSSGTIKFNIANNGTDIDAVMVIDGITVNLTSSVTWQSGQPYLAPFSGSLNGQNVSITFSVDVSGANPTITSVNIPGHPNAVIEVFKETSNSQVVCFEGTFSGTDAGNLNLMLSTGLGAWAAAVKSNGSSTVIELSGSVTNNQLNCINCSQGITVTGTINADQITNGTWTNPQYNDNGTWSANKTL